MKLIYLTNVRLPTEKAHGFQIMKMCEAFAETKPAIFSGVSITNRNGDTLDDVGGMSVADSVNVELIVPRRLNPIKDGPFSYYGVKKNFKITRLPCIDLISFNLGRIGYWIEMTTFLLSAKIYLLFKKYDVLYTREFALGSFFSDYILEVHDLPKAVTGYHICSWRKARKLIVLTSFLKEDLVAQGIPADKIKVSPDGVDLDEFFAINSLEKVRLELRSQSQQKIVMYTGSFFLYGWKGVDILLEAAKKLPDTIKTVLIGGNEKEIENVRATIGDQLNRSHGNIELLGRIPHHEIPSYLKSADILVLPNKKGDANSERYTSPLKLFEYMASGVPIVSADLPSMREVLNEKNCAFFAPGDSGSLVKAIGLILNDYENANAKARQALEDVKRYTWKNRAQSILSFLN